MSNFKKFLSKSVFLSGLVAMSFITLPLADASAQNKGKGKGKGSVASSGGGPISRVMKSNRGNGRVGILNRGGNRGSGNVVRNRGGNRGNATVVRNRGNRTAIRNNAGRAGPISRVVNRNRGNTTVIRNRGNRTVVNNYNRPFRGVVGNNRGYRNGYRPGYRNNGYRYNRYRGNGAAFATGLVGGALLYSAFNSHNYYDSHIGVSYGYGGGYGYGYPSSYYYGPSYYRPRTRVVYVQQPVQTVIQQAPSYQYQPQQGGATNYQYQPQQSQDASCLQVREYTTTIEIGGESVPAYGEACLQPDGSWKFGDPIAEPSF